MPRCLCLILKIRPKHLGSWELRLLKTILCWHVALDHFLSLVMTIKTFVFIYLCSVFIAIASGTCYFIDGNEAADRFTCSDLNTVNASMCCEQDASAYFNSCINGICAYTYAPGAQGQYDNELAFWRDSCSDPTWRDPACVKIASCEKCLDEQNPNVRVDYLLDVTTSAVRLSKCADGTFCPRNTDDLNATCCDNHQGESVRPATLSADSANTRANPEGTTLSTLLSHRSSISTSANGGLETSTSASFSQSSSASSTANLGLPTSTPVLYSSSATSPGVATSTSSSKTSNGVSKLVSSVIISSFLF